MSVITVYVKNMAGDLVSVELSAGSSVEQLVQTLYVMDKSLYPSQRTHVYRSSMEEKKEEKEENKKPVPLEDGEVVSVFVSEEYTKKTGIFEEDIKTPGGVAVRKGAPYTQFIVPIANKTIYLYAVGEQYGRPNNYLYFLASFASDVDDNYCVTRRCGYRLYDVMKDMFYSITPGQMKTLYDIIDSHYKDSGYIQDYNKNENVMCDCGSIVRRMCLIGHYTMKKHISFMKTK